MNRFLLGLTLLLGLGFDVPVRADVILENQCIIYLDWDHTFNCSWNIFDPAPCAGACEALADAVNNCLNSSGNSEDSPILCSGSLRGIAQGDWDNALGDCGGNLPPVQQPGQSPCVDLRCAAGGGSGDCEFESKLPRLCQQAASSSGHSIVLIDNHCSPVDCAAYGYPGASIECVNITPSPTPSPTPTETPPPTPTGTPPVRKTPIVIITPMPVHVLSIAK